VDYGGQVGHPMESPMRVSRILVQTDFSPAADKALDTAMDPHARCSSRRAAISKASGTKIASLSQFPISWAMQSTTVPPRLRSG
jgi:hypothetical protein